MKNVVAMIGAGIFLAIATTAGAQQPEAGGLAAGDPAQGEGKAAVCAACHGPNGNSVNPQWPKLAGQGAPYLAKQMYDFKAQQENGRNNPIMYGQAVGLSDQDIADLSAYFAGQTQTTGVADPELVERGAALYRGGDPARGIPACTGCHSPTGRGNAPAVFPRLSGQHADYLAAQLTMFRQGERANDPNNMMRGVAERLSDQDIAALASYLQGLRP